MSITSLPKSLTAGQEIYSRRRARRALIIGTDSAANQLARDLRERSLTDIEPLAFIQTGRPQEASSDPSALPVIGGLGDLPRLIAERDISVLFLADADTAVEASVRHTVARLAASRVTIYRAPAFYEQLLRKVPSICISEMWFLQEHGFRLMTRRADAILKRIADLLFGFLLSIALLPIMLIAAIAVKLDSPGPILYSQMRTGKDGKPFRVFKFRSMFENAEQNGARWASEGDPRITRVGRFLRSSRIDELPQLWNVLKGEMSLIGPRPERPEFDSRLAKEIPHYRARYAIKPGLSGWAQVMYPYGASVEDACEKLAYDLYYLKNGSALLDLVITYKTILVVLFRKGR